MTTFPRPRKLLAPCLVAACLVATVGCGDGRDHDEPATGGGVATQEAGGAGGGPGSATPHQEGDRPDQGGAGDVVLARLPDSREGDAARVVGKLGVEGGCVYLDTTDGELLIASTVPGARWDAGEGGLVVPAGEGGEESVYRPGDAVALGGSQAATALDASWVVPPAPGCAADRVWIASNITSAE